MTILQLVAVGIVNMSGSYEANEGNSIINVLIDQDLCPVYTNPMVSAGISIVTTNVMA